MTERTTPKIVELLPRLDVPKSLRWMADEIEAGKYGDVRFIAAVMIHESESARLFAWGQCSDLEIVGALAIGHHRALTEDGPR